MVTDSLSVLTLERVSFITEPIDFIVRSSRAISCRISVEERVKDWLLAFNSSSFSLSGPAFRFFDGVGTRPERYRRVSKGETYIRSGWNTW